MAHWGDGINRYNATTGELLEADFVGADTGGIGTLDDPVYLARGPDGNLWVSSQGNGRINRYDFSGNYLNSFIDASDTDLANPSGFAWSADHSRFFVTDRFSGEILEYEDNNGDFDATFAGVTETFSNGANTFGLQTGPDGFLYVGIGFGSSGDGLYRVDPDNVAATTQITPGGDLIGVEFGPDGGIYYADYSEAAKGIYSYDYPSGPGALHAFDPAMSGPNFFHFGIPEPSTAGFVLSGLAFGWTRRVRR